VVENWDYPSDWKAATLGEVANIEAGGSAPQGEQYFAGKHPFVRVQHLDEDGRLVKRWNLITDEAVRDYSLRLFPEGTILLPKSGASIRLEKRAMLPIDAYVVSHLAAVRPRSDAVEKDFLFYFLRSCRLARDKAEGYPVLNLTELKTVAVALPPLPEQRAIAEVLLVVQRAKEATEKVIAALRELKKSLLKHLFTYGPVPFDQADKVPLKETEIGLVPEHWSVGTIGDFATQAQYGLSLRGERKGQYPILRMNNLQEDSLDTQDLQYVNLDPKTFAKFRLHAGDVLFNRTNSFELVGKTAVFALDGDYVFASYLVRLGLAAKRLRPALLNYYVNMGSTQARLKTLASRGVSQSNINATKLKGFSIPVPPPVEQDRTVAMLRAAESKMAAEKARRETLEGLFRTLLHNLMTGKVRLRGFGTASPSAGG
jgi:type I restriction enzyme S subunit